MAFGESDDDSDFTADDNVNTQSRGLNSGTGCSFEKLLKWKHEVLKQCIFGPLLLKAKCNREGIELSIFLNMFTVFFSICTRGYNSTSAL